MSAHIEILTQENGMKYAKLSEVIPFIQIAGRQNKLNLSKAKHFKKAFKIVLKSVIDN